jgi:uncharacterized membrane protein YqgA involved in biofilm formation
MTGTFINTLAILAGGLIGLRFGSLLKEKSRDTIIIGLGLFTLGIGVKLFLDSNNALIVLGGLLIGGLLGEWMGLETGINALGGRLEARFNRKAADPDSRENFVHGFLTSSILFCTGPMAILGAMQDGLMGDFQLLVIKSVMDGFAAFALASTLGPGVLFSALAVFIYQGAFSLLAIQLQDAMTAEMIAEMSATGGLLLMAITFSSLWKVKAIRVGNFIPSLAVSPLIVYLLALVQGGN